MLGPLPTEEDWAEWLAHPCTKRLQEWALTQRQGLMEAWANGGFAAAFTMEMAVKHAGAAGGCSVYKEIIELDYQQIGADIDAEQDRPGPAR